jgi:ATP-dependent helicase YprA (DUF1998 family)
VAPLKALCSEKFNEWSKKFDKLHGFKCVELTGDSEYTDDEAIIENANIICTTPVNKSYAQSSSKVEKNNAYLFLFSNRKNGTWSRDDGKIASP